MEPRIYVACLAAYNNGRLHGEWIPADRNAETLQACIDAMLLRSPVAGAEEWAVHGYKNMADMGEYPTLDAIAKIGALIAKHGKIVCGLWADCADADEVERKLDDDFHGVYETKLDYVYQLVDDLGYLTNLPDYMSRYFDYDAFLRDIELSGDVTFYNINGEVFVFGN